MGKGTKESDAVPAEREPSLDRIADSEASIDGRRARRERGRVAVLDAVVDLVFDGDGLPSAEQVAQRAGVSVASIYRYFATLDTLRSETTIRYFERHQDLFEIPNHGKGGLVERIETLVKSRAELYEATAPMSRLVRERQSHLADLEALLHLIRDNRRIQIAIQFAPELETMSPVAGDDLVGVLATITSFEAWDRLCRVDGRSPGEIRRAWISTIATLLAPASPA